MEQAQNLSELQITALSLNAEAFTNNRTFLSVDQKVLQEQFLDPFGSWCIYLNNISVIIDANINIVFLFFYFIYFFIWLWKSAEPNELKVPKSKLGLFFIDSNVQFLKIGPRDRFGSRQSWSFLALLGSSNVSDQFAFQWPKTVHYNPRKINVGYQHIFNKEKKKKKKKKRKKGFALLIGEPSSTNSNNL